MSVEIPAVPIQIRTSDLAKTSLEKLRYANPLGKYTVKARDIVLVIMKTSGTKSSHIHLSAVNVELEAN
jgi:hypothetical protein